jgi:molybdate transport repressor ModE-like protein
LRIGTAYTVHNRNKILNKGNFYLQKHTMDDLNDLRCVAAIAATGSLSGAARKLGVNHATVFRRLAQFEERLGVRLFERHGGRYGATAAGEEIARAGAAMEEQAQRALLKVAGRDLRPSGEVRLTTTDSVAQVLLNPAIARCRALYPRITLQLGINNEMADLSRRDADIAIRPSLQPPEHLIGKRIGPLALAVYGAPSYLAQWPQRPLAEHEWIALDDAQSRHRTLRWLEKIKPLDQVGYRISGFSGVRAACVAGLGLALLPCFLGDGTDALRRVLPPDPAMSSELWLLTHPDLRETVRIQAVFKVLQEELAKVADLVAGELAPEA